MKKDRLTLAEIQPKPSDFLERQMINNGDTHIYKTTYKGVTITFYLSGIGSAVASSQ